jgi:hypothetical protein
MVIIFAGTIGRFPVGGHAWIDMQYLLGLRALGHDVYYLEECGAESWVYDWRAGALTTDLAYPTDYVRACLEPAGLGDRWIYRAGDRAVGMPPSELLEVCRCADLLIVRGAPLGVWREEHRWPRRRAFVDVDPGFTQIRLAKGQPDLVETVARCERAFTIAQRIGAPDCSVPAVGIGWLRTLSPVHLPAWPPVDDGAASRFTTIMQWRSYHDVEYGGVRYGNKEREFPRYMDLPRHTAQPLQLALTGAPAHAFRQHGWEVVEGWAASLTPEAYQRYVQRSRAELCVAKHGYVATRAGWFSDRSVCYLASGRPVLVQDTGLEDWLPTGEGLLVFGDPPGALRGIDAINADYGRHRAAARRLAEEYFAADRVLPAFLDAAMS